MKKFRCKKKKKHKQTQNQKTYSNISNPGDLTESMDICVSEFYHKELQWFSPPLLPSPPLFLFLLFFFQLGKHLVKSLCVKCPSLSVMLNIFYRLKVSLFKYEIYCLGLTSPSKNQGGHKVFLQLQLSSLFLIVQGYIIPYSS